MMLSPSRPRYPIKRKKKSIKQEQRQKQKQRQEQRQKQRLRLSSSFNSEAAILAFARGNEFLSSLPSFLPSSSNSQKHQHNNQNQQERQRKQDKGHTQRQSPLISAMKIYTTILSTSSPGHPGAFLNRSLCYLLLRQPQLAAFDARRAIMAAHYAFDGPRGNVQERQLLACQSAGCIDGVIESENETLGDGGDDWGYIFGGGQQKQGRRRHWTDTLLECDDIMDIPRDRARWTQRPNCYVCKGRVELLDVGLASIAVTAVDDNTTTTAAAAAAAAFGKIDYRDAWPAKKRDRAREISQLCVDVALKGYYRLAYALWKCGGGALMSVLDVLTEAEGLYGVNYSSVDRSQFNALGNRVLEDIAGLLRLEKLSSASNKELIGNSGSGEDVEEAEVEVRVMLDARYTKARVEKYPWDENNLTGGEYIDGTIGRNDNTFKSMFPGCEWQAVNREGEAIATQRDDEKHLEYRLVVKKSPKHEEEKREKLSPVAASRGLRASISSMLDDGTILCSDCCASIWILDELCEESSQKTSISTIFDQDANRNDNQMNVKEDSPDRMDVDVDPEHVNTKGSSDSLQNLLRENFDLEKKTSDVDSPLSSLKKDILGSNHYSVSKSHSNPSLSAKLPDRQAYQTPQEISCAILKSISVARAATPVKVRLTAATPSSSPSYSKTGTHDLRICPTCNVAAFCSSQCYRSAQDYHMSLCETGLEEYSNADVIMDDVPSLIAPPPEKQKLVGQILLKIMGLSKGKKTGPLSLPVVRYLKCGFKPGSGSSKVKTQWNRKNYRNQSRTAKDGGVGEDGVKDEKNYRTDTLTSSVPWSYDANILRPLHFLYTLGGESLSLNTEDYDGWMINTLFAKIYHGLRTHPIDNGERVEKHFDAEGRLVAERVVVEEHQDIIKREGGRGSEERLAEMDRLTNTKQTNAFNSSITSAVHTSKGHEEETDKAPSTAAAAAATATTTTWIASLDPILDYIDVQKPRNNTNDDENKEKNGDNTHDTQHANAQLYQLGSSLLCVPLSVPHTNINKNNNDGGGNSSSSSREQGNSANATVTTMFDADVDIDAQADDNDGDRDHMQAESQTQHPQTEMGTSKLPDPTSVASPRSGSGSGSGVVCRNRIKMVLREQDIDGTTAVGAGGEGGGRAGVGVGVGVGHDDGDGIAAGR